MDGIRPGRGAPLRPLHALVAVVAHAAPGCPAHSEPSSRRGGPKAQCDAFPSERDGLARLTWRFTVWARGGGPLEQRQVAASQRIQPSGSWGACREERQVHRVMNVVHAIRGTFGQARADRPDDDEAVLVSQIRIEEDRGGYATAGGLLAVGV